MKRSEIKRLLPRVFRATIKDETPEDRTPKDETPLGALLDLMAALQEPSEMAIENLDATFDPRRTADAFVPYLGGWVDLERLYDERPGDDVSAHPPIGPGMGRLRELVASAAWLSQWRGTSRGLVRFLEIATGVKGFTIEEELKDDHGLPLPFQIRVRGPKEAEPYKPLVERIIRSEKPAYVKFELVLT